MGICVQVLKAGRRKFYAMFSTISMEFLTEAYTSLRKLEDSFKNDEYLKSYMNIGDCIGGITSMINGDFLIVAFPEYSSSGSELDVRSTVLKIED